MGLLETHVSWVFRAEREVIKVKKPLDLGFLDFRSPEARRMACANEVSLNARLAPEVYLGVLPIVQIADGSLAIGAGNAGAIVDWAVRMKRLHDEARADTLLARRALAGGHVDAIAAAVAELHAGAPVEPRVAARYASRAAVERLVRENFEQSRVAARTYVGARVEREVEARQRDFLRDHAPLFAARIAAGRVRDGHGDLRLEHAYFEPGGLRIIDCIEFDERYRVSDVAADVAFLSMDLAGHGRVDLAEHFLARYARAADDYDLYALVDFYEGYRAWVRGKVSAILAADEGASEDVRRRAGEDARRHFVLAQACERPALLAPTLVCVGGLIASGKSTVSEALAEELSCPVIDADRTRKHMLGFGDEQRLSEAAWKGAYGLDTTRRVYAELLRRAAVVLGSGRSVVIDASFRSRRERERARALAQSLGMSFRFVECRAPVDECRRRLALRKGGPSDATTEIFDDFVARYETVEEIPPSQHVAIDTTRPLDRSLRELRARIATWPRGMVA